MKRYKSVSVSLLVLALLLVSSNSSVANVRAIVRSELPPSSALFSPSRDLTVLHEDLQFDCDSTGCQVSASYLIQSKRQAALKMSFISPSSSVETVTVNGANAKPGTVLVARFTDFSALSDAAMKNAEHLENLIEQANKKPGADTTPKYQQLLERSRFAHEEWDRLNLMSNDNNHYVELFGKLTHLPDTLEEDCQSLPDLSPPNGVERYVACLLQDNHPGLGSTMFGMKQEWELYQFDFDAVMLSGKNTLQVRYHQPHSFSETEVAYFSSSPPMRYLSYELWPLKEWTLDAGFKIDITVKFHNPPYGFLYRKRDELSLFGGRFKDMELYGGLLMRSSNLSPLTSEVLPDDYFVYKTSLQGDIPDRLFIRILGTGIQRQKK